MFFLADAIHHFGPCRFGGGSHDFSAGGVAQATPQGLAAHGDRLGLFARLGPKALDHLYLDLLSGKVLDLFHKPFFIQRHQTDGFTAGASAARATDAVHIVFGDVGNFVIHHMR